MESVCLAAVRRLIEGSPHALPVPLQASLALESRTLYEALLKTGFATHVLVRAARLGDDELVAELLAASGCAGAQVAAAVPAAVTAAAVACQPVVLRRLLASPGAAPVAAPQAVEALVRQLQGGKNWDSTRHAPAAGECTAVLAPLFRRHVLVGGATVAFRADLATVLRLHLNNGAATGVRALLSDPVLSFLRDPDELSLVVADEVNLVRLPGRADCLEALLAVGAAWRLPGPHTSILAHFIQALKAQHLMVGGVMSAATDYAPASLAGAPHAALQRIARALLAPLAAPRLSEAAAGVLAHSTTCHGAGALLATALRLGVVDAPGAGAGAGASVCGGVPLAPLLTRLAAGASTTWHVPAAPLLRRHCIQGQLATLRAVLSVGATVLGGAAELHRSVANLVPSDAVGVPAEAAVCIREVAAAAAAAAAAAQEPPPVAQQVHGEAWATLALSVATGLRLGSLLTDDGAATAALVATLAAVPLPAAVEPARVEAANQLLHAAAQAACLPLLEAALRGGAVATGAADGNSGETPLMVAVSARRWNRGVPPLHQALECVDRLVAAGADPAALNTFGEPAAFYATTSFVPGMTEAVLRRGFPVTAVAPPALVTGVHRGGCALHYLVTRTDLVRPLARPQQQQPQQQPQPPILAALANTVRALVAAGCPVDARIPSKAGGAAAVTPLGALLEGPTGAVQVGPVMLGAAVRAAAGDADEAVALLAWTDALAALAAGVPAADLAAALGKLMRLAEENAVGLSTVEPLWRPILAALRANAETEAAALAALAAAGLHGVAGRTALAARLGHNRAPFALFEVTPAATATATATAAAAAAAAGAGAGADGASDGPDAARRMTTFMDEVKRVAPLAYTAVAAAVARATDPAGVEAVCDRLQWWPHLVEGAGFLLPRGWRVASWRSTAPGFAMGPAAAVVAAIGAGLRGHPALATSIQSVARRRAAAAAASPALAGVDWAPAVVALATASASVLPDEAKAGILEGLATAGVLSTPLPGPDAFGTTPLHRAAATCGTDHLVRFLVGAAGADVEARDMAGRAPRDLVAAAPAKLSTTTRSLRVLLALPRGSGTGSSSSDPVAGRKRRTGGGDRAAAPGDGAAAPGDGAAAAGRKRRRA